jgi:glucokinase
MTQVFSARPATGFDPVLGADQVLGFDVGGTALKLGRFDLAGNCLQQATLATPRPSRPKPVVEALLQGLAMIDPDRQAKAIGVGMPGPADPTGQIARIAINMDDWDDVPLGEWLTAATGLPTVIENDANCAGIGEHWRGAGQPFADFLLLTLGTGVGGAIFLNNQLYRGREGAAGELGLITLNPAGDACRSGNSGSLEQHLSIGAIQRRTGQTPETLGELAQAGDRGALEFWHDYGETLGAGLSNLIYVLTPAAIVIGGGISASYEFFAPSAIAAIDRRVMPTSKSNLKLMPAQLGNQAGMLGASKLAGALLA